VLVAVAPVVLEGAYAAILELVGLDDVVEFHAASTAQRGARYDAAIVSHELAADVDADVVITLPDALDDEAPPSRQGRVDTRGTSDTVDIRDQRDVIDLLDRHLPLAERRGDRLMMARSDDAD
jgi:hypothetical protein